MANISSSNGLEKRPKLRFPGFDEPWTVMPLSSIFEKNTCKNSDGTIDNVICNSAKYGLIPQREYFDKDIANSDNVNGYYIIEQNDFVYNPRKSASAPYGPVSCYKYANAGIVSPLYLCFKAKFAIISQYYEWYFKSAAWYRYIYMSGDSGVRHDRVSIKDENFFVMPICVPSENEQKRIVLCLNEIEAKIEKQRALVEALKKYKRGLFSFAFIENENNYTMEAMPYPFSELAHRRTEKYDPRSGKQFPCIELEHIEQETGRVIGCISSVQQHSIKNVCKPNDVLFGKLRPYLRKYAFAQEELVCSSEIWPLVPSKKVLPKYLFYLVQTKEFIRMANVSSGTKMPRADWSNMEKGIFYIPDINTQTNIINLLESIDLKIADANTMSEKLTCMKSGFLQRLFI